MTEAGLWPRLRGWADRFVPPTFRGDADQTRRAHVLFGLSLVCAVSGAIFSVLSVVNVGLPLFLIASLSATFVSAMTPFLLRATGSIQVATSVMLSAFAVAILAVGAAAQEQSSLTLPWLAVFPLVATALAGSRTGIAWGLACVLLAELQIYLGAIYPPAIILPAATVRSEESWNIALLITYLMSFAVVYESRRRRMVTALLLAEADLTVARERAVLHDRLSSLGRMAAGVAHEINNPMTFVSSNVALLREDLANGALDEELRREYVDDILPATADGIRRVIDITVDLRRFARGDSAKSVAFDLNDEVRAAVRMCEASMDRRCVSLRLGELPAAVGRPREIVQVAMNLVVNALYAVKDGGEVRVETEAAAGHILLRVIDDGAGMTPSVQARLFEPFFTTKPPGEGTGLGLAAVHGIVHAHGGSIRVESRAGEGTTVEIQLPLAAASPGEDAAPRSAE